MDGPPPPPPPHGTNPKTTGGNGGLPPGNYDIFIIPPHSSGGGFVYLPSLQVQRNSFLAGVGSTLATIAVWKMMEPTIKQWFVLVSQSVSAGGNGVVLLVAVVGVAGWAYGKTQVDGGAFGGSGPGNGPQGGAGTGAGTGASGAGYQRPPPRPNASYSGTGGPPPQGGWQGQHQQHGAPPPPPHDGESWSGSQPDPDAGASWEKAREETRKREEERKAKEEAARQARAKAEKEKWEKMRAREREQREREARERIAKERAQREKDAKEREEKARQAKEAEARAKIEKEIREKLEAEQKAKAAEEAAKKAAEQKAAAEAAAAKAKADAERAERLKAARERAQRDREARLKAEAEKIKAQQSAANPAADRRSTTYGGLGGGERFNPYSGATGPPAPSVTSTHSSPIKATVTPKKNYEKPSATSYVGTEDEHSFRPYDTPRRPPKPPSHASTAYTASSYAASHSTARTTPPPSQRGPYSTNDPDKIQIKAVYLFNDLFPKPVAQLVANVGKVTDGLILKVQSEGLFIDDDVRNIPQREWDVKAWTLKLVEVSLQSGFVHGTSLPLSNMLHYESGY